MPTAADLNIEIDQGASFEYTFQWSGLSGAGRDLNGFRLEAKIFGPGGVEAAHGEWEQAAGPSASGSIIISVVVDLGMITLRVAMAATQAFHFHRGWWYLEAFDDNANPVEVTRLLKGRVTIHPRVAR